MNKKNFNNLKHLTSYQSIKIGNKDPETTSFNDFRIAEHFGTDAIQETYNSLCLTFGDVKCNPWYYVELLYILNRLCWMHFEWKNIDYSKLYTNLFYELKYKFLEDPTPEMSRMYYDYID